MSFDLAVWSAAADLDHEAATRLYGTLCEGDASRLPATDSIERFYRELTAQHPEIDDIPEADIDDTDLCPWSIAFDRSPAHLIICCVWSRAEYVFDLLRPLASKHDLALYDPQQERIYYPPEAPNYRASLLAPWGRLIRSLRELVGRTADDSFVVIQDRLSEKFIQFGRGPTLTLDLPASALDQAERERAGQAFARLGVSEPTLVAAAVAAYQLPLGADAPAAAATALSLLDAVYGLDHPDWVLEEN